MNSHARAPAALSQRRERLVLRGIALFEGLKGIAALALAFGLLELVRHDIRRIALALIGHYHLDPAGYPGLLLQLSEVVRNADFRLILALAIAYAALRFTEGYGLWFDRAWAEWLAATSGALYMPFEVVHLLHKATPLNVIVLLANVATVAFMTSCLRRRGKARPDVAAEPASPSPAQPAT